MTVFREILQEAVEKLPGAQGAAFLDWEGETVDAYCTIDQTEMRLLGAHWGIVYHLARGVVDRLQLGPTRRLLLRSTGATIVIQPVTDHYYAIVMLLPEGHLGRAMRTLDTLAARLREQM